MPERTPHVPSCRECSCPNCEPTGTQAMAERNDAWLTANRNLTDGAKDWPKAKEDNEYESPVTFDAVDVLTLANWLYSGEYPQS